jgi:hypothetical protein
LFGREEKQVLYVHWVDANLTILKNKHKEGGGGNSNRCAKAVRVRWIYQQYLPPFLSPSLHILSLSGIVNNVEVRLKGNIYPQLFQEYGRTSSTKAI